MKNLLIVEDDTQLQGLYKEGLAKQGLTDVTFATTVPQGLGMLAEKKPDLLILDIMLSKGGNGFDMLEQMKKDVRFSDVPVFVITNLDSQEKTARQIGVADYIVKTNTPFEKIIDKIVTYLA